MRQKDCRHSSLNEPGNDSSVLNCANGGHSASSPFSPSLSPAPPATEDLNVRLRAAMAIAKTLSDFHNGGVAHNDLTPDNIVLDEFEGEYVATFIDLSEAAIISIDDASIQGTQIVDEDMVTFGKQMKQKDLKSLGAVLNQLFRGIVEDGTRKSFASYNTNSSTFGYGTATPPETRSDDVRSKRNKQNEVGEGLPIYLGSLISTLLLTGSELKSPNSTASTVIYESAKDVYLDLKTMLENQNQCYRKAELDEWLLKSRLNLDSIFFHGRQVEVNMLLGLLQGEVMLGDQPSIATISGK
jgi:serine/threonine protein kinase